MINKIDLEKVKVPAYLRLDSFVEEINKNLETLATVIQSADAQGVVTVPGPQGDKGEQGERGFRGEQGPQGEKGETGAKGEQGIQGERGLQGEPGAMGSQGLPGVPGIQGIQGLKGEQGAQGVQGPKGDTGAQGLQGIQGLKGDKGDTGAPGAMNYKVYAPGRVTGVNAVGRTILSTTFTSTGNPVMIIVTGDANPTSAGYIVLQLFRNNSAIGMKVQAEQLNANVNVPYCVQVIDTPPAGTYTYSMQTVTVVGGTWDFGEQDGPTMTIVELTGATGPTGPAGVGIKGFASGYVDAGQFVTLDNLKFTVSTGGSRGLCAATVSGTVASLISGYLGYIGGGGGSSTNGIWNITTTLSGSFFGWSFPDAGGGCVCMVNDTTNQRFYRVTLMIGPGYSKNFISIERLG